MNSLFSCLFCSYDACFKLLVACALLALPTTIALAQSHVSARPVARLITTTSSARAAAVPAMHRSRATSEAGASLRSYAASVAFVAQDEQRIFELINEARRTQGLAPLVFDAELSRVARAHSGDMAAHNFINHTNTEGLDAAARARRAGVGGWRALGENIALNQGYDDPAAFAVERWMKSAKHRANITHAAWTHTGLGVARAADGTFYFTQVFVVR